MKYIWMMIKISNQVEIVISYNSYFCISAEILTLFIILLTYFQFSCAYHPKSK